MFLARLPLYEQGLRPRYLPLEPLEPEYEERVETMSIADVVTGHLRRIKDSAQHFLGHPPQGAVYTVPTNFSTAQREELKICSEKAGIPVLQIIHEPTAALLAWHSLQNEATHMARQKDPCIGYRRSSL